MTLPRVNVMALSFLAAVSTTATAQAAATVLVVEIGPNIYPAQTTFVRDTLIQNGIETDYFFLGPASSLLSSSTLDRYDEVWVIDFSSNADDSPAMFAAYSNIATWWNTHDKHLILDARLHGSSYNYGTAVFGYPADSSRPETQLILNYHTNLSLRGGGLVLATDNATAFTRGINTINTYIGVGAFTGSVSMYPYMSLFVGYAQLGYPVLPAHHNSDDGYYIYSDSGCGLVPTGEQSNGLILTSIALFGGDTALPTVSTTIRGGASFAFDITAPTSATSYVAYSTGPVQLTANAVGGIAPYTYAWTSSVSGTIGAVADFSLATITPVQTITVVATDDDNVKRTDTLTLYSGLCDDASTCPAGMFCADHVCCNTACDGDCMACSVAAGAAANGTCGPVVAGTACDDHDVCTVAETCNAANACASTEELPCNDDNACTADSCDSVIGCVNDPVADGTTCDDGSACTENDACLGGACVGDCNEEPAPEPGGDADPGGDTDPVVSDPDTVPDGALDPDPDANNAGSTSDGCSTTRDGSLGALLGLSWLVVRRRRPAKALA